MAEGERESRDYYLSRLGLPFGASEGYHTFLQSPPPHSPPGPSKGVVREPHRACQASPHRARLRGQGVRRGRKWPSGERGAPRPFCGRPQKGRTAGTQGTEEPGERKAGGVCVRGAVLQQRQRRLQPTHPTLCREARANTKSRDAGTRRPRAESLSPRPIRAPRGTTRRARPNRRAAAACAAPPAGRPAPRLPFPRLPRPRRPVRERSRGALRAPGPSGPRRGQSRPALTSEVFFFLPLPQSHLSAVTGRRKEK